MPFLIALVLYAVVFGVIVFKRLRLARFFIRVGGGTFRAVLLSGLTFAVLEEGTLNLFGTPLVLIVTVPTLVAILLLVGYGLKMMKPALSWGTAGVAYVVAGLIFESVVGSLGQSIRASGVDGSVVFGFVLNVFAYTYIGIVPLSILFPPLGDKVSGKPPSA